MTIVLPSFNVLNYLFPLHFDINPPDYSTFLYQVIIILFSGEVLYYGCHRVLHHPSIYRYIHKIHHEYTAPIGIVSLYAHPLEILLGNVLALIGPVFFFRCDLFTFYIVLIFGFIDSITDYSGYDIKNRFHDRHHEKTKYNYGSIGILDYICGTYYA